MNDIILIKNIQNGINEDFCLDKLCNLHSNIYFKMINAFISDKNISLKQELFAECKYQIYFAAKEFDFSKNTKFSTFLANKIKWACLNINMKNRRTSVFSDVLSEITTSMENKVQDNQMTSLMKQEILEKIFVIANKSSDKRISKIFTLRYIDGEKNKVMPWKNVSKELNLSIQGCINIHNNFINSIKERKLING